MLLNGRGPTKNIGYMKWFLVYQESKGLQQYFGVSGYNQKPESMQEKYWELIIAEKETIEVTGKVETHMIVSLSVLCIFIYEYYTPNILFPITLKIQPLLTFSVTTTINSYRMWKMLGNNWEANVPPMGYWSFIR